LRFIAAPAAPSATLAAFVETWFVVTPQSNRIGFRLRSDSGAPIPMAAPAADLLSEPLAPGTLQLPPDGQPILLMADRQTVGGYPILGHVISADRPKAAQLWPGDRIRFASVSLDDARAQLQAQTVAMTAWLNGRD
jgi:antagonist of KipI